MRTPLEQPRVPIGEAGQVVQVFDYREQRLLLDVLGIKPDTCIDKEFEHGRTIAQDERALVSISYRSVVQEHVGRS